MKCAACVRDSNTLHGTFRIESAPVANFQLPEKWTTVCEDVRLAGKSGLGRILFAKPDNCWSLESRCTESWTGVLHAQADRYTFSVRRLSKREFSLMSYSFEFDSTNSILQGRFGGFVDEQEVSNYYQAAVNHVARLSPRSYVLDVSAVTSANVSYDTIRAMAKLPPILPDPQRPRFIVASSPAAFGLMRMYELEGDATRPNLHVVHKHAEAWAILGIREPRFNPLPDHVDIGASDFNRLAHKPDNLPGK